MKRYNRNTVTLDEGSLQINNSYEGETIEMKVRRITESKEPITDGAPVIYTDRKDGTRPEFNIRTDRFDIALDAMDYVNRSRTAKRMEVVKKESSNDDTKQATGDNKGTGVNQGTDGNQIA